MQPNKIPCFELIILNLSDFKEGQDRITYIQIITYSLYAC